MALTGDEERLIRNANMHLPGRQVDPSRVRRDLWRLSEWERQRRGSGPVRAAARERATPAAAAGRILEGPDRAAARAYLKGIGYDDEALARPIVGIANTWTETMPCNFHLRGLAEARQGRRPRRRRHPDGVQHVAVSDGITMGTEGMKTSLVSREVIADSIELVARGHMFDAVVALSGCDKTIPGCVMALARLDVPSLMLYGGSIAPGRFKGKDVTIQDVFEAVGAHAAGNMTDEDLHELEDVASPGAGACGGQFTANTMATAFEMLGISRDGHLDGPRRERQEGPGGRGLRPARHAAARAATCSPSAIITRESLENAIACVAATGGSTNAVLHLLAVAKRGRRAADDRRLRPHLLAPRRCSPTSSPAGGSSRPTCSAPAASPSSRNRLEEAGLLHERRR